MNFGIPGGLGAQTLVDYAKATYKVALSIEDAGRFRQKLITEVFPELSLYLSEDSASILARQLQSSADDVRRQFTRPEHFGCMRRIVKGETVTSNGKPYCQNRIDTVWRSLRRLNHNLELTNAILQRDTIEQTGLARKLFGCPIQTLTGRIRGHVSFTAARSTPFQGLAADGAKLAMYRLIRAGYCVHAFIHYEFLLSLPDSADWTCEPERIDRIICEAMGEICGNVPIEAEAARMRRWYKKAGPIVDNQTGELLVWQEPVVQESDEMASPSR